MHDDVPLLDNMEDARSVAKERVSAAGRRGLISTVWALVVLLFAGQWYVYDLSRAAADPFVDYLWWSFYMWAVLTPLVLWFSHRHPINIDNWKRVVPLHLAASVALTVVQLSVETYLAWLRHADQWSFKEALRHYFSQHTQLSLLTYWVLVAGVQLYRLYDQARRRELQAAQLEARLAEARLDMLRTQLQPHFLFNTLQAATILVHEDPSAAEEILLRLSELLRVSLDDLHVQEVSLAREIEFLDHYIAIQQRRFGDRLRFEVRVEQEVRAFAVPTLVLQPLVENAIRHGLGKHKEPDIVTVRGFQSNGRLCLEVYNQIGHLEDVMERLLLRGLGLANTKARLEQLYGRQQSLKLRNLKPSGVAASLSLPLRRVPAAQSLEAIGVAE